MRLRFSIRTVLIVTTLFACVLYWHVRPAMMATSFANAIADKEYDAADALVTEPGGLGLVEFSQNTTEVTVDVSFDQPTIADWLVGQRRGRFDLCGTYKQNRYATARRGLLIASSSGVAISRLEEMRIDPPSKLDGVLEVVQIGLEWANAAVWYFRL
jgi:hypothetical protein